LKDWLKSYWYSEEDNEILNGQLGEWIDSLDELSQIEIAFQNKELNAKNNLG
jgi:hypothetical protein